MGRFIPILFQLWLPHFCGSRFFTVYAPAFGTGITTDGLFGVNDMWFPRLFRYYIMLSRTRNP